MEEENESNLPGYPNIVSYECSKEIIKQMEKNICRIKIGEEQGTGFFCKIPFPIKKNKLPVFITNNHIINEEILYKVNEIIPLYFQEMQPQKITDLKDRIKYTNEEYDITIIEIKEKDNIKNYLKLGEDIIDDIINNNKKNKTNKFIDKIMYILQYPESNLSVSFGILENLYGDKEYDFKHKCSTRNGSSGSPKLNLSNILNFIAICFYNL